MLKFNIVKAVICTQCTIKTSSLQQIHILRVLCDLAAHYVKGQTPSTNLFIVTPNILSNCIMVQFKIYIFS